MIREGQLVCDACLQGITRITSVPEEGWEKMHNLCSSCFAALSEKSVARG
ncbi:MAG TPA: hypothetical protein VK424_02555 [Thermoplasmata archaeon]|nr:hypothetical protein [Thermoplasmata archaeon]